MKPRWRLDVLNDYTHSLKSELIDSDDCAINFRVCTKRNIQMFTK